MVKRLECVGAGDDVQIMSIAGGDTKPRYATRLLQQRRPRLFPRTACAVAGNATQTVKQQVLLAGTIFNQHLL